MNEHTFFLLILAWCVIVWLLVFSAKHKGWKSIIIWVIFGTFLLGIPYFYRGRWSLFLDPRPTIFEMNSQDAMIFVWSNVFLFPVYVLWMEIDSKHKDKVKTLVWKIPFFVGLINNKKQIASIFVMIYILSIILLLVFLFVKFESFL